MRLCLPKPIPVDTQTFLDTLTVEDYEAIRNDTYSTTLLRNIISNGISACGCKMFAKMPADWLNEDVSDDLSNRLNPDQSVKKYREYYIVLAENETDCIVRLCPKDEHGNIGKGMMCSNEDMMVLSEEIEPHSRFYNEADAIIEKNIILGV